MPDSTKQPDIPARDADGNIIAAEIKARTGKIIESSARSAFGKELNMQRLISRIQ